jgi:hypothetical protein
MLASFAALTGQPLAEADAPDSFNVLPALLGEKHGTECREYLVEQTNAGDVLALRKGPWKFVPGNVGAKGRAAKVKRKAVIENPAERIADKDLPPVGGELYNLGSDLSETTDTAAQHPDILAAMQVKLAEIKASGHSRPGIH